MFSSLTSSPCLSLFIGSHSSSIPHGLPLAGSPLQPFISPATSSLHHSHSLDLIPLSRRLLKLLDCVDDSFRRLLKRRDRLLLNLVSLKASPEFRSISRSFLTVVSDRLGNERKSFDDEFGSSRRKSLSINGHFSDRLGFDFVSDENEAISQIINSANRFLQIRGRDSESWKRRSTLSMQRRRGSENAVEKRRDERGMTDEELVSN